MGVDKPEKRRLVWRRFRLGEEPGDDLSHETSAEERIAMMWPLALEAWTLSRRSLPRYARNAMPIRVIRRDPGVQPAPT